MPASQIYRCRPSRILSTYGTQLQKQLSRKVVLATALWTIRQNWKSNKDKAGFCGPSFVELKICEILYCIQLIQSRHQVFNVISINILFSYSVYITFKK